MKLPEYDKIDDTKFQDYIDYKVKPKDSLYSIAKRYNTTVDQILKDNNIKDMTLMIGQNLIICNEKLKEDKVYDTCYGTNDTNLVNKYVVKEGDSIYSIAKKYNISIDELKQKNKLSSNKVYLNQILNI